MTVSIWTQQVTANWRPRLSFFEHRLPFLRAIEGAGDLHAFRVEQHSIAVRLRDEDHELELSASSLSLSARRPAPDLDRLTRYGERAFEAVAPPSLTRVVAEFQYLAPLQADYNTARTRAAEAIYGRWAKDANITDTASLLDGRISSATYAMEFGIVSSDEIPGRLERSSGRMSPSGPQIAARTSRWKNMDLPRVALFADSRWFSTGPPEGENLYQGVLQYWEEVRTEASRIVEKLALLAETALSTGGDAGER